MYNNDYNTEKFSIDVTSGGLSPIKSHLPYSYSPRINTCPGCDRHIRSGEHRPEVHLIVYTTMTQSAMSKYCRCSNSCNNIMTVVDTDPL